MSSYVYLLMHALEPCMKIGKADCVRSRAMTLGPQKFDLARSWVVRVADARTAYDLETALGKLFKRFRVARSAEVDGRTEWYDARCLERALQFIEREADLIGATVLRAGELPGLTDERSVQRPTRQRRPCRTKEELEREYRDARLRNDEVLYSFLADLAAFREVASLYTRAPEQCLLGERALRLFFVSHSKITYEQFHVPYEQLGRQDRESGGGLILPQAAANLLEEKCRVAIGEGVLFCGFVDVKNPGDPYLRGFISGEGLNAFRNAVASPRACPFDVEEAREFEEVLESANRELRDLCNEL